MAKSSLKDVYGNRAFEDLTMSAANTITFEQIQFGVGLFQGVAMVLSRVEFYPTIGSWNELVATTDALYMAITNRDDLTNLDPANQNVLVLKQLFVTMVGAVVGIQIDQSPLVCDMSTLPGGGLIVPANPLYFALHSAGFAAAAQVRTILYFTFRQLADSEYVELIQTIMPANL